MISRCLKLRGCGQMLWDGILRESHGKRDKSAATVELNQSKEFIAGLSVENAVEP